MFAGEDLLGHARGVLGVVVEEPGSGHDLSHAERFETDAVGFADNANGEFATGEHFLDQNATVVPAGLGDCRADVVEAVGDPEPHR